MIEKIEAGNSKILEIEKSFPQFLLKNQIQKDFIDNPFTQYYIYLKENKIVGFINYDILYERAELIYIAVLEEYQKEGIGSQLLEYMIGECENQQLENITLEVSVENQKAIRLYQKFGFKKVATRKKYYQGIDGILMEKELIE
ncbi:MAG: ribosomal protein S18-alanine N-acetyltransferase [Bacilli bacterium]|nr:ribosomal protein S18-alanine N-acetyltransferase [Bacilli bacterium]